MLAIPIWDEWASVKCVKPAMTLGSSENEERVAIVFRNENA